MKRTIKIAPSDNEITIVGDEMKTDFAGGVTYKAEGLSKYDEAYLKQCFSMGIAMCGKRWVLEEVLNGTLNLNGKVL